MSILDGDINRISASFNGPNDADESDYPLFEAIGPSCGLLYELSKVVNDKSSSANVKARVVLAFDLSEGRPGNGEANVRGYLATRRTKYDGKPDDPADVSSELERLNRDDEIEKQLAKATVSRAKLRTLRDEWIRRGTTVEATSQHRDLSAAADKVRLRIALQPFFKSPSSLPASGHAEAPIEVQDPAEQGERQGKGPKSICRGQSCPGVWKLS